MKRNVTLSTYSVVMSCLFFVIIGGLALRMFNGGFSMATYAYSAMIVVICGLILFYSPVAVSVDDRSLNVHRILRTRRIPLADIESVERLSPTMAEKRLLGAGGWFGHWGWMKEPLLGLYFAYYGKSSDCFLVRLRNGRQYLLGCSDPDGVVAYVRDRVD